MRSTRNLESDRPPRCGWAMPVALRTILTPERLFGFEQRHGADVTGS